MVLKRSHMYVVCVCVCVFLFFDLFCFNWPFAQQALGHLHYEQTLYSRGPCTRTGVSIYLYLSINVLCWFIFFLWFFLCFTCENTVSIDLGSHFTFANCDIPWRMNIEPPYQTHMQSWMMYVLIKHIHPSWQGALRVRGRRHKGTFMR